MSLWDDLFRNWWAFPEPDKVPFGTMYTNLPLIPNRQLVVYNVSFLEVVPLTFNLIQWHHGAPSFPELGIMAAFLNDEPSIYQAKLERQFWNGFNKWWGSKKNPQIGVSKPWRYDNMILEDLGCFLGALTLRTILLTMKSTHAVGFTTGETMWEFHTCWKTPFVETSVLNTNSIQLFSPLKTQQFPFLPANHHVSKSSNDSWILPFCSLENHQAFPTKGVAFKSTPNKNNLNQSHPGRLLNHPSQTIPCPHHGVG